MKMVLFTLTSARSGTVFLRHLFRNNLRDCVTRHEPFFDWGNPTLFGRAIYDAHAGRRDRIQRLLEKKRDYINRQPGRIYVESSHAFLKSAHVAALDVFPDLRLIHLVRHPIKVARSEAYREEWRRRVRAPFHFYTGDDGRRHFVWALTRNEEIFRPFDVDRLSLFQLYLIQWIEIENRAMRYLDEHGLHDRCFRLHSPDDLNNPDRLRQMFDFFGLETRRAKLVVSGRKNRSFGRRTSDVTRKDEDEAAAVLEEMPAKYLEIFQHEPYTSYGWSDRLRACQRAVRWDGERPRLVC